jgi:hypothetical protein
MAVSAQQLAMNSDSIMPESNWLMEDCAHRLLVDMIDVERYPHHFSLADAMTLIAIECLRWCILVLTVLIAACSQL